MVVYILTATVKQLSMLSLSDDLVKDGIIGLVYPRMGTN